MAGTRLKKSTTCKVCSRTVRYDNPSFPYCNYHVALKTAGTQYDALNDPEEMELVRNELYNPPKTIQSPGSQTIDVVAASTTLSPKMVSQIYKSWSKSVRGMDIFNTEVMYVNRDAILDEVASSVNHDYDVRYIRCEGGKTLIDDSLRDTREHRVLLVETDKEDVVLDVATAAPLVDLVDTVGKSFRSGKTTCANGLHIANLFEYGAFSSIRYKRMIAEDRGEVVWHNMDAVQNEDVELQRDLVQSLGYNPQVAPKVEYLASASDWMRKQETSSDAEVIQEPSYTEPQSIEDILGFD